MRLKTIFNLFALGSIGLYMTGCSASGDNTGREYAPQMYHSVAYEPLTQIKEEDEGKWLSNREDGKGEFFNSNVNNPNEMNMRIPPREYCSSKCGASLPCSGCGIRFCR